MTSTHSVLSAYLGIMPRTPEAAVLRLLVELAVQYVGADEGSLLVLDRLPSRNGGAAQSVFAMTAGPAGAAKAAQATGAAESERTLVGQRVPLGRGLTGLAAATGEVQIGAPTFKDVKQRRRAESADGQPTAVMAAPMLIRDEVVGVITAVSFDRRKRFAAADASLYAKVASVAAVVVDQHRRLRDIENLRQGRRRLKPLARADRLQAEIVGSVGRLVRGRPDRLAAIRSLLGAIGELSDRSTR